MTTRRWIAVCVLCVLVGAGAGGFGVYVLRERNEPAQPGHEVRAHSLVDAEEAGMLAERFRPRLMFDTRERWRPMSLEAFFAEDDRAGRHRLCDRPAAAAERCDDIADAAGFFGGVRGTSLGGDTYLDVAGRDIDEYRSGDRAGCSGALQDCGDRAGSAIYYRVTASKDRFYIDYWWFLRFNHFRGFSATCGVETKLCAEHEGDWEGVTVVTVADDPEQIDYVAYAAHDGVFRYPAGGLERARGRPVVYVAEGSHASYPQACPQLCVQPIAIGGVIDTPETAVDGLRAWERNDERCRPGARGSCLQPLPAPELDSQAWTAWRGLWGSTCGRRCGRENAPQAPQSPGLQQRFLTPWCSTRDGLLTCDSVAQGCSDWLGPQVAAMACNPRTLARGLQSENDLASGGLAITLTPGSAKVSATTAGIVQVLSRPLRPGSLVTVSGAGADTQVLVRARKGNVVLEARFDPFKPGAPAGPFRVRIPPATQRFVARGEGPQGRVQAVESRTIHLPPS